MQPTSTRTDPAHPNRDGHTYYYKGHVDADGDEGTWAFDERWQHVAQFLDLRPTDRLLDMGCAEGLITLEAATQCAQAIGVELQPQRVEYARKLAAKRGLSHVQFECASACDFCVDDAGYDVTLLLGVYHHLPADTRDAALSRLLHATKRRMLIKTPFRGPQGAVTLCHLASLCQAHGFNVQLAQNPQRGGDLLIAER